MSELKLLFDVYVFINLYCTLSFTTLALKCFLWIHLIRRNNL